MVKRTRFAGARRNRRGHYRSPDHRHLPTALSPASSQRDWFRPGGRRLTPASCLNPRTIWSMSPILYMPAVSAAVRRAKRKKSEAKSKERAAKKPSSRKVSR